MAEWSDSARRAPSTRRGPASGPRLRCREASRADAGLDAGPPTGAISETRRCTSALQGGGTASGSRASSWSSDPMHRADHLADRTLEEIGIDEDFGSDALPRPRRVHAALLRVATAQRRCRVLAL